MGDLPKLAWSRDVTGKVDNIHSNLTQILEVHRTKAMLPIIFYIFFQT